MSETYLHGVEVIEIDDGVRPIQTARSSVIGVIGTAPFADATAFPLNTPVLLINAPRKALGLVATRPVNQAPGAGDGTLPQALDDIFATTGAVVVVIRVAAGVDEAATLANIAGSASAFTGVHGFVAAPSVVATTPKILIAPGFTHQQPGGNANPIVAALKGVASKLRAIVVADAPNTIDVAAADAADDAGSDRVYLVDPWVKTQDSTGAIVVRPPSALVAGLIARSDDARGFWFSPSNQELVGVVGTGRPVTFGISDPNTTANWLNERKVTTIIQAGGYRLWGNRSTGEDPQWAFLSVRRTADMIYEAIERAYLWALDRPASGNLLDDVVESVAAYLRELKAKGAILGGKCWVDPELNTSTTLKAGKLYINFDIEPPAPIERLTFRASREDGYYSELIAGETASANTGA